MPEDVTIADGVDTATVTVVVRGVTERTLTVSRFTFENVPEGMTATAETESLNVPAAGPDSGGERPDGGERPHRGRPVRTHRRRGP